MKKFLFVGFALIFFSCKNPSPSRSGSSDISAEKIETLSSTQEKPQLSLEAEKKAIADVVDAWHKAAADANFKAYFEKMTDDAVFIGTDATENWNLEAFKAYAKPYFDEGKAWAFTSTERNIYLSDSGKLAWFDELLDTHFGICRGSGVLIKENGAWKIKHYVLSFAIPNEIAPQVTKLKLKKD